MLNEFTSYTSNLDATKNDSTHKIRDRGYCPNGTDIGRPVAGSLPIPPPSSSWNYPYLSNPYIYYNPSSYELGNVPQYDNQKCSSQYVRNYNEHSSRFHSTSVLQCCDPRCQLIAKHAKYPYHPVNTKISQHPNKRTKNYYSSIVDSPKPDASVTGLAPSVEHTKYTPCVPYPTLRNDLNGKYGNQPSEYCSPFSNTLKRGTDSTSFNEYYTDIGNPSYWNKPNSSIWNRSSSSSYYPPTFEDKNTQKIDQGNFANSGTRGILFNRLLEHRDHPYDTGYAANYYYGHGPKNDLNPNINYHQPNLPCEPVINNGRLPLQTSSYQPPPAYNIHYPPSQTIPQYYKENTPKKVQNAVTQETRILDKNPNLDVREFLSTWEDDVDDEKVVEPTNESPVIVLDCSNLEGDVLAKVKEKLNGNGISNDDTAILKIVDVSNSGSAAVLSPHTSVIQENSVQSKEIIDKSSLESSHMNSDGYMTWYGNNKKKEDFSYDLVEMTEKLVNTVGKLLTDPEKKVKPASSSTKESASAQLQDLHSRLPARPLPVPSVLSNNWNADSNVMRPNINIQSIPTSASSGCHRNISNTSNASYNNYTSDLERSQQPLTEKNVSCTFNLQKTSNDLKFSVNYSTLQNDYSVNKMSNLPPKFKATEFTPPYYEYHKTPTVDPSMNTSNYKSYSTYSSYYENTGCNYDQTKLCNTSTFNTGLKDNNINYVDHIEKHAVNDNEITLVKADLEKSLNEISHNFKSNNNNIDKNCQYFDSNCSSTTDITPKCNKNLTYTERTRLIETQTYNGVIQKTGICDSPLQKIDSTACNDNLLSMPSLSPPPNSSSSTTRPIIPSPPVPQNNEQPLCGINLTLTDVYENEDTIFGASQAAETNSFTSFCSDSQTANDQTYQPLNLAVSRDTKPPESNVKDEKKIPDCNETNKIFDCRTNSKADDGYYSVENAEADEISINNCKKSSHGSVSIAYHPCIVSHEQPKPVEIHSKNQSASETILNTDSSSQKQQDYIITTNQQKIGDMYNSYDDNSSEVLNPSTDSNKKGTDEILHETNYSDELSRNQSANSSKPALSPDSAAVQSNKENQYNSQWVEKLNYEYNSNPVYNLSNSDSIADTTFPCPETKSNSIEKVIRSDEGEIVSEKTDNDSSESKIYDQEDTALNLIVQSDTPTSCGSVIKENENFIHPTIRENNISLPSPENNHIEASINCSKNVPEPSHKSDMLINDEQSPQSISVDQVRNCAERGVNNCTERSNDAIEEEVKSNQLKRKLIDASISNTNLPMKKRKGQEYLTQNLKSLEPSVTPPALTTSTEDSAKESHFLVTRVNQCEENEQIVVDIPRKNKKKRKKDKSKNNLKHKKYSKFKRHSLSAEQNIVFQKKSHSVNKNIFSNSAVPEINIEERAISSSSSSPIYNNNDDLFNIPSVAPTPQFDLIQDFEPQKEQFNQASSANFNFGSNICKSDFINSSVDLHMTKAPSPHCILQDDSFVSEKASSKAPSPYYDFNYGGVSPSSVAPSPNYDIIEGVLFDDTDSSRNNEDIDSKNKTNLQLENTHKHLDFRERLGNFNRITKYSITENEYESDYDIDRYHFKRKRDGQVKRLGKKSRDFLKCNYYENRSRNHNNTKFSANAFRHFDYAVDDERCIRSEDDEYEPRPNHIRHAFKPKAYLNCVKTKDNGKHVKKYNTKYNQREKKRTVDSKCDFHIYEEKSAYISYPEYQSPVSVSSQCDKIISKFQMIEATRSDSYFFEEKFKNEEIFEGKKLNCSSPSVISRSSSHGEFLSDLGDNMVCSQARVENTNSPSSMIESDTETSDFQDTSKSDSNYLQNGQDINSSVDSTKELDIESRSFSTPVAEKEENESPVDDTRHTNHLAEYQPSDHYSPDSNTEKLVPEENYVCKNVSSQKLARISGDSISADQQETSFNGQSVHSPDTSPYNISYERQCDSNQLEADEGVLKEANDEIICDLSIPNRVDNETVNNLCTEQSTILPNSPSTDPPNTDENITEYMPEVPSGISCAEVNDNYLDTKNDENLSANVTRTGSLNADQDSPSKETMYSSTNLLSEESNYFEKSSEVLQISKSSSLELDYSLHRSESSIINDEKISALDTIGESEITEDELVHQKSNSPLHSKVELFDCLSGSPEVVENGENESEKLLALKKLDKIERPNSPFESEYNAEKEPLHSPEKVYEVDNMPSNDQNEPVCSFNTECSNDITQVAGCINQNTPSPDPVIHCPTAAEEVCAVSAEDHPICQKNLSRDSSASENFSNGNENWVDEDDISNEREISKCESANETEERDGSTSIQDSEVPTDLLLSEKSTNKCDFHESIDFDKVTLDSPKTAESDISAPSSPVSCTDGNGEEIHNADNIADTDACQRLSPLGLKNDNDSINESSVLESYSQETVSDPFNDTLDISNVDNNIDTLIENYESSSEDTVNSDSSPDHQSAEDHSCFSDDTLFALNNSDSPRNIEPDECLPTTSCDEITDITMEILPGLCDTSNCLSYEVPTLRFLAIQALSRVTINNNLLEVRETPEHTEIIIHSDEHCDPAIFEGGDSSNMIMTDTFDDDTHVSPNFEALKEMTFDYPTLPESTSGDCEEKNDEDLPCQCLIISSEESILCLRCSLNSSVGANQFHELDESCEVSVGSIPGDSPFGYDCVEGSCIEQSFIDQEINFAPTSPANTFASIDSSPCPPVVENIDESTVAEKTHIKVSVCFFIITDSKIAHTYYELILQVSLA